MRVGKFFLTKFEITYKMSRKTAVHFYLRKISFRRRKPPRGHLRRGGPQPASQPPGERQRRLVREPGHKMLGGRRRQSAVCSWDPCRLGRPSWFWRLSDLKRHHRRPEMLSIDRFPYGESNSAFCVSYSHVPIFMRSGLILQPLSEP